MKGIDCITREKLREITAAARAVPRLRKNYNLHHSDADPCHRFLNAVEPESYIQPHRHLDPDKDETLVVLRGKIGMLIFREDGGIEFKAVLEPNGEIALVNIPSGVFHTWVSLEEGTVFFESKAGPFVPISPEEKAPWAPPEEDERCHEYLSGLRKNFD